MALQDLNRGHWLLIGAVVGGLLSYSRLYDLGSGKRVTPEDHASAQTQTISADELVSELRRATAEGNAPQQAELTLYPQINNATHVSGRVFRRNGEGIESYRDILVVAPIPFKPADRAAPRADYTLRDEIDELARSNPRIRYRVAWWTSPAATIGLWGGGSILAIGVIWPSLISLAIGAGLAPRPRSRAERKRDAAYLASFKSAKEDETQAGKPPAVNAAKNELQQLTQTMEQNLQSEGTAHAENHSVTQTTAAPVRKLESGPVEAAEVVEGPKEDVDWGGEFYPVAHPKHGPNDPMHTSDSDPKQ